MLGKGSGDVCKGAEVGCEPKVLQHSKVIKKRRKKSKSKAKLKTKTRSNSG